MKRKEYQKPTMQVVKLQHRSHILTTSGKGANGEKFIWDEDE